MLDATGICHMNRMDVLWIFRFASYFLGVVAFGSCKGGEGNGGRHDG